LEADMKSARLLTALLLIGLPACDKGAYLGGDTGEEDEVVYPDEDGDTIMDHHEGEEDPDDDGKPNFEDTDSDDDGIPDSTEAGDDDILTLPIDTDNDEIFDFLDDDSDANCIKDETELAADPDGDGIGDFADTDNDGDGISDTWEIGEDCGKPDSDGDGTPDYLDIDSDGDGVGDLYEGGTSEFSDEPVDTDGDGTPDYLDGDSDGDGFLDRQEAGTTDPTEEPADTDGDGTYDFADEDSDGDGLSDGDEALFYGTDPYSSDTDGDGFPDGAEVAAGTNPDDPFSIIDAIYVEVDERMDVEETFQFELNIQMGDVAFLLDTTCSMASTVNAMAGEFSSMVSTLSSTIPDAEYGVATFDDYNYGSYGTGADKPFELLQQVTSDVGRVQSTLSTISLHNGSDGPESGMEALFQGLTGDGYDQNCNRSYDSSSDVRPFLTSTTDAFGGGGGQSFDATSPGGGSLGGYGFRDYALPIVVYATDNQMRGTDTHPTPGGCYDASSTDVVNAALDLEAYLIGISVSGSTPVSQMQQLASATGSYAGSDMLVYTWTGSSSSFRDTITDAIADLVSSVRFELITLEVEGDDNGFVVGIEPSYYALDGAVSGEELPFTLLFRGTVAETQEDQLYALTLNVLGDGTTLLDTLDIYVLVPGTSYSGGTE